MRRNALWLLLAFAPAVTAVRRAQSSASLTGRVRRRVDKHLDAAALAPVTLDSETHALDVASAVNGGAAEAQRRPWVGTLAVLSGALCHLALGTIYCWGNFISYMPPHLRFFDGMDHPGVQPDAFWVLPGAFIFQMLTMPIGPTFQAKLGCRMTTLLGCWMQAAGVYFASRAPNLALFMLCYSGLFGAGIGIAYTAPMVNGWRWFPGRKGLVSGAVVAGFGAGGFIFNRVGSLLANPSGINAVSGRYPPAIYANFPPMLRKLALIYAVMTGLGALLVNPPPAQAAPAVTGGKNRAGVTPAVTAVTEAAEPSVGEALKTKTFWLLWVMALGIGMAGINVANVYKSFAGTVVTLRGDDYQSLVGSLGALFNGAGRLFWGNILDAKGFRGPFACLAAIQAMIMALYPILAKSKVGFAAATCVIFSCLGGNFAMFPAVTTRVFGSKNGAAIYGCMFSAFALASIAGTFLTKLLQASLGWGGLFRVLSAMSVGILVVLSALGSRLP